MQYIRAKENKYCKSLSNHKVDYQALCWQNILLQYSRSTSKERFSIFWTGTNDKCCWNNI